jgi:hypothetical protein
MSRLLRLLLIGILALVPSMAQASVQTVLILNSQPGDYLGGGLQQTFTPADGPFTVTPFPNGGLELAFHTPSYSHFWTLEFAPPSAHKFVVNEYEGTQRLGFGSPNRPGMDIFGDGRGCNTDTGRFLVSDIAYNPDGTIARLAIDFEQHCEGATAALYGSIRYNSSSALVPRLGIGSSFGLKGNTGTSDARFVVALSMPSSSPVTVHFATADGSGIAGTDYVASTGTLTFPPGVTSVPLTLAILGDRLARGTKSFKLQLSNPSGASFGVKSAVMTILDPNGAVTLLSMYGQPGDYISAGQLLVTPQDGTFTTSRNYDNGVSVALLASDWWETDFAAPNNVTLFQVAGTPGLSVYGAGRGCNTLTGNFNVLQANYDTAGNVKSFSADFEQHCEGLTPGLFGSLRINAKWRQISVTDAVVDLTQSTATFTVTLNPPSATPVSVSFATADGTALSGIDYAITVQDLMFSAGETTKPVSVPVLSPTPGKVFYGQLSAPSGAPIWIGQASATF